jgi:hypothetical protein
MLRARCSAVMRINVRKMHLWLLLLPILLSVTSADDFEASCSDRAAIERVYYRHRLGDKPSFEQVLPRSALERMVRQDLLKEATLKRVYGDEITGPLLDAEVQRIDRTTRAPDILAEIKTALGHDSQRFSRRFAQPMLVDRRLREHFENDDKLHTPMRQQMARVRARLTNALAECRSQRSSVSALELLTSLLQQEYCNDVHEITWRLGAPPEEKTGTDDSDEAAIRKRFGPNAQILSSPKSSGTGQEKSYFSELPLPLQRVLDIQLRQAGDVSAVIEMPNGFLLYVVKERTKELLSVAALYSQKYKYEEWLAQQAEGTK